MRKGDLVRFVGDTSAVWSRRSGLSSGETGIVLTLETREYVDESGGVHYHDRAHVLWPRGIVRTVSASLLEVIGDAPD